MRYTYITASMRQKWEYDAFGDPISEPRWSRPHKNQIEYLGPTSAFVRARGYWMQRTDETITIDGEEYYVFKKRSSGLEPFVAVLAKDWNRLVQKADRGASRASREAI